MNLEESIKRFGLSNIEMKHTESYREKAEKTKVIYCPDCTGEFYDFEGECQLCKSREGNQFSGPQIPEVNNSEVKINNPEIEHPKGETHPRGTTRFDVKRAPWNKKSQLI